MHELTFQAKVRKQNKITIPLATVELLGLSPGDNIIVTIKRERVVSSYP